MSFFECEFPKKIAFSTTGGGTSPAGGPGWSTMVNMGFSGLEQRNRNWANVRNKYALDLVAVPLANYQTALDFFINVGGRADAFRFFDQADYAFTLQPCSPALGDGNNKVFQLQKIYTAGVGSLSRSYTRTISKPIMAVQNANNIPITTFDGNQLPNTVSMYINGVLQAPNLYTVDATTGLVSFVTAPGNNLPVAGSGQFHVPVRFDSDDWPAQVEDSPVGVGGALITVVGITLVEVKILAGQSQG